MAAMVLDSPRAVEVSVYVVRAILRLREAAVLHKDLAERLASMEEKTEALAMSHGSFSRKPDEKCSCQEDACVLHWLGTPNPDVTNS